MQRVKKKVKRDFNLLQNEQKNGKNILKTYNVEHGEHGKLK